MRYGLQDAAKTLARFKGEHLELLKLQHPFYDRQVPIIVADHVTTDAGTGAVHTAPAHGPDDFLVGKKYQLPVNNPVTSNGTFASSTELFAGEFVFKANPHIVDVLRDSGRLLNEEEYPHSYPHCWRHKTPMIYRATAQWFIGMSKEDIKESLRAQALQAINTVKWLPEWGEERIRQMIENRPDWCISRQRNWGVPIAIFLHKETGAMHPRTLELMNGVAEQVEQQGIQAWEDIDINELLGEEADEYDKVTDTLDVWFDSGVSHQSVLNARKNLSAPADLYLEGSDQHRGWFQSSLLTSVAISSSADNGGMAPYKTVLTHGFTVDKDGKKMAKSMGNVIAPQTVINKYGADVLRLWVAATDYRSEMTVSDEILKRTSESYRRIRNTTRYLLGNLAGFNQQNALPYVELLSIDKWAIRMAANLQTDIENAFENFQFHSIYQRLHRYCVVDMGGFYLDILKDRLYTLPVESTARLSAQTAMHHILEGLVRCLMPILSFTAEEIWGHMHKMEEAQGIDSKREDSVLFATRYLELGKFPVDTKSDLQWQTVQSVRNEVSKQLEGLRNRGEIGSAL